MATANQTNGLTEKNESIISAKKINPTTIEIQLSGHHKMLIDFYGENIFRIFQDNSGGVIRDPESKPDAKILVNNPRRTVSLLVQVSRGNYIRVRPNGFILHNT